MGVAVALRLSERVSGRGLGPPLGVRRNVVPEGDAVGGLEADAVDLDQAVGILVEHPHRLDPVARMEERRDVRQSVRRELDVQVADGTALVPAVGGGGGLAPSQPGKLAEDALRVGRDRLEDRLAVDPAEGVGAHLADVAQGGEVGDLALAVRRVEREGIGRAQLVAVARVLLPDAVDLRAVARLQVADGADDSNVVAGALVESVEDRERPVVRRPQDVPHGDGQCLGLAHVSSQPRCSAASPPG